VRQSRIVSVRFLSSQVYDVFHSILNASTITRLMLSCNGRVTGAGSRPIRLNCFVLLGGMLHSHLELDGTIHIGMTHYPAYVYWITHTTTGNQHYIGCRKSQTVPAEQDIGVRYFTSQKGVDGFANLLRTRPRGEFHIHIVSLHDSYTEAQLAEAKLLRDMNAVTSDKFYNRAMFSDDAIRVLHSEDTRERMRRPRKRTLKMGKYVRTPEMREALRDRAQAMNTPEANAKKSVSHTGKPSPMLGHSQSQKQRLAVAESNRRRAIKRQISISENPPSS
jgi:hypothetical protein